jgi:dihydropyrimidinase
MWEGIIDGTISIISSDHVGYSKDQKALGNDDFSQTPNGIPGMEERLPVIYTEGVKTNRISLNKLVALLSTNPAKMWGLYPQKGSLTPGTDADIVIVDIVKEKALASDILHAPAGWTPYEGRKVSGFPYATISKGRIIMENDKFMGEKGHGVFLRREKLFTPSPEILGTGQPQ